MPEPITRHELLKPLSREHHHGLLLCWRIRTGLGKSVQAERIKAFADWYFNNSLLPHFQLEEEFVFPILGSDHPGIKRAMAEHRRLKRLFCDKADVQRSLSLIEEELERHIRFEERSLFKEIQCLASEEELNRISELHIENASNESWQDKFWL